MSLYPSLEDMQAHKVVQAQQNVIASQVDAHQSQARNSIYPNFAPSAPPSEHSISNSTAQSPVGSTLYPGLYDFMGLELTDEMITLNVIENSQSNQVATMATSSGMIAPLSNQTAAFKRSQLTHGIREVILCRGSDQKIGLAVKDIDKGVFITFVGKNSPAALVGLRFGDQILQINGVIVAGFGVEKVHKMLSRCGRNDISMIIRDRPFERTVTMHKDSLGRVGFHFQGGRITAIVQGSSAARNGLLIDHQLLEVNGQHVVGMKDKDVNEIIMNDKEPVITVTIIPLKIYQHMMKKMCMTWFRNKMDYSASSADV